MRKLIKKLWNRFLHSWRIARLRSKIAIHTFFNLFKKETKISDNIEKEFMKFFSDLEDMITDTLRDLNGPELNPGSA